MTPSTAGDLSPSLLARALTAGGAPWTTLEIKGAEKLSELPDGSPE